MIKELICITCPKGCHLSIDDDMNVKGNSCKRGEIYAKNEVTNPTRMITSTVKVLNGDLERCPVVTSQPIKKGMIFEVMNEINKVVVEAPVNIKDIIIENVLNTNVNIVATRNIEKVK